MIDLILAVVIAVALLLGLLRGLIGVVVPVVAWVSAGVMTIRYGERTAFWLSGHGRPSMMEYAGGYVLSFFVVLVVVLLLGMAVKSLIRSSPLSSTDRVLGGVVGFVTGVSVACVAVALLSYTSVAQERSWQTSLLRPVLEPGARWVQVKLPDPKIPSLPELLDSDRSWSGGQRDKLPSVSQIEDAASQLLGDERFRQSSGNRIMSTPTRPEGRSGSGAPATVPGEAVQSSRGDQGGRVERRPQ